MSTKYSKIDNLAEPEFGRSVKIHVWEHGDNYSKCHEIFINPNQLRTWNTILTYLTKTINPIFGAIRKLVSIKTKKYISCFKDLENNGRYIAVGLDKSIKFTKNGYKTESELEMESLMKKTVKRFYSGEIGSNQYNFLNQTKKRNLTIIFVLVNGITCQHPTKVVLTGEDLLVWSVILEYLATILDVPNGIKSLCTIYGDTILNPVELQHGYVYVVLPHNQRFISMDYMRFFSEWDQSHKKGFLSSIRPANEKKSNKPVYKKIKMKKHVRLDDAKTHTVSEDFDSNDVVAHMTIQNQDEENMLEGSIIQLSANTSTALVDDGEYINYVKTDDNSTQTNKTQLNSVGTNNVSSQPAVTSRSQTTNSNKQIAEYKNKSIESKEDEYISITVIISKTRRVLCESMREQNCSFNLKKICEAQTCCPNILLTGSMNSKLEAVAQIVNNIILETFDKLNQNSNYNVPIAAGKDDTNDLKYVGEKETVEEKQIVSGSIPESTPVIKGESFDQQRDLDSADITKKTSNKNKYLKNSICQERENANLENSSIVIQNRTCVHFLKQENMGICDDVNIHCPFKLTEPFRFCEKMAPPTKDTKCCICFNSSSVHPSNKKGSTATSNRPSKQKRGDTTGPYSSISNKSAKSTTIKSAVKKSSASKKKYEKLSNEKVENNKDKEARKSSASKKKYEKLSNEKVENNKDKEESQNLSSIVEHKELPERTLSVDSISDETPEISKELKSTTTDINNNRDTNSAPDGNASSVIDQEKKTSECLLQNVNLDNDQDIVFITVNVSKVAEESTNALIKPEEQSKGVNDTSNEGNENEVFSSKVILNGSFAEKQEIVKEIVNNVLSESFREIELLRNNANVNLPILYKQNDVNIDVNLIDIPSIPKLEAISKDVPKTSFATVGGKQNTVEIRVVPPKKSSKSSKFMIENQKTTTDKGTCELTDLICLCEPPIKEEPGCCICPKYEKNRNKNESNRMGNNKGKTRKINGVQYEAGTDISKGNRNENPYNSDSDLTASSEISVDSIEGDTEINEDKILYSGTMKIKVLHYINEIYKG